MKQTDGDIDQEYMTEGRKKEREKDKVSREKKRGVGR